MARHPEWIRVRVPAPSDADGIREIRRLLERHRLTTVCQGAACPNAVDCWKARTATFMLLGDVCTRSCRFCAVASGDPGGAVDDDEPRRLAAAIGELGLGYAVLTSVDRDDLPDGGVGIFAAAVEAAKRRVPALRVEALIPDFGGDRKALDHLAATDLEVFGHNVETVRRLTPQLRDRRASYERSLDVLADLRSSIGRRALKSGLMVGLGETDRELVDTLRDLRDVGVDIVTIGQYLRPSETAVPVARYVSPAAFGRIAEHAEAMGFRSVVAAPLARSSYRAAETYAASCGC